MYEAGYTLRCIARKFGTNHRYIAKLTKNCTTPDTRTILKRRLLSKVAIVENCWVWIGSMRDDGYGEMFVDNKHCTAHRLAFKLFVGDIPAACTNVDVLHKCNNKRCINPDHLYLGTDKDNRYDALLQGAYSDRRTLSADERDKVFSLYKEGIAQRKIADLFCVGRDTIQRVLKEKDYDFRKIEKGLLVNTVLEEDV
jgi:hypothetical protein